MSIILANQNITLHIEHPDEGYQGSRFDHTGKIIQIEYKKRYRYCTTESTDCSTLNTLGRGLFNEFGIDSPIGYIDCPVNSEFHKIGTGLITRENSDPYDFYRPQPLQKPKILLEKHNAAVKFYQETVNVRGVSFKLVKIISLSQHGFKIWYELENTGTLPIYTNEYTHNFLSINDRNIDSSYRLKFSFPLSVDRLGENVNKEGKVVFYDDFLTWKDVPTQDFFFSYLNPCMAKSLSWELENYAEGSGIREIANYPTLRVNLWGKGHVVSPEIFFPINIAAGKYVCWERVYECFEL